MQRLNRIFVILMVAMSAGIATLAYAEAPVYEADSLQQQFENAGNEEQDYPPPPPPAQEGVFIPTQQVPHQQQQQVQPPRERPPTYATRYPSGNVEDRMRRMEQ